MKTVIIVQARMGSTRLPGKILEDVGGVPLLVFQHERLSRSRQADAVTVATSTNAQDDVVADLCERSGIPCFRGSEHDVLLRYRDAAVFFDADVVVRNNADCPFIDPVEVDRVIEAWFAGQPDLDYAANILDETFPLGMHTEVFSRAALERAHRESTAPEEREHVTPYIYRHPDQFQLHSVVNDVDLSQHRWTIDYPEDLAFTRAVVERLAPVNRNFGMSDIVALVEREPALRDINAQYRKPQNLL